MNETDLFREDVGSTADEEGGCCAPALRLDDDLIDADVRLLSTLANETRYEALRLLAASEEELCACEIEGALPVSQSAVSQALSALYAADLVERRKDGRWRYYRPSGRAWTILETLDAVRGEGR
ncbi:helix-turn-helix transcriptional regulator [Halalkalicoccus sp. NIPERK01]|uniref:ArsR/SmtB family transcription factor n=1 Tax=Halalkalicoccus sp. NIPERK01 TaxID=3053469 RepID=UPI00256F5548|nr:metalloregulator ArsR/SmtB family transcription factor [Halalkalicoccus sp. NIPERK01]MDL5361472.1 metalloregulator ArsR/SmtB family transcription factor [Halalkalicoccus sp. NIPERK01]